MTGCTRHKVSGIRFLYSHKFIFLLYVLILIFISSYAEGYILSVGHIPPSRNGHTFLLITDLSGLGPTVEISFYDEAGNAGPSFRKLLSPNGKTQIDVESYLRTVGTIVLKSNDQIAGEYWQAQGDGKTFILPLQRPVEEGRYFINCFRFPSCRSNLLVISDPYGSGPVVQMEFYNKSGELLKVAPKLLPPYGISAFRVDDYVPWDVLGKVSIRSFRGSIILHYRESYSSDKVTLSPGRLPSRELLIDKFSIGRGITSNLVITDVSAEGPTTKIRFLMDNGEVYEAEKLLSPNGTILINPADHVYNKKNFASGVIQISSEAEIIADYWEKNPQTVINVPAINETGSSLFISYFSLYNSDNLISLLNVGREPVNVDIRYYSISGERLGSEKIALEPYKRVDKSARHYFNGERLGTIIVSGPNARMVVTSHILEAGSNRHLGKAYAQVIR